MLAELHRLQAQERPNQESVHQEVPLQVQLQQLTQQRARPAAPVRPPPRHLHPDTGHVSHAGTGTRGVT